jgi:hypothetical protein
VPAVNPQAERNAGGDTKLVDVLPSNTGAAFVSGKLDVAVTWKPFLCIQYGSLPLAHVREPRRPVCTNPLVLSVSDSSPVPSIPRLDMVKEARNG